MINNFYLKIFGPYACFTNIMKVERVSYSIPPHSVCRGILESILYKKEFRYNIKEVAVKKPIQYMSIKKNELQFLKINKKCKPVNIIEDRTQRHSLILKDVEYIVHFNIDFVGPVVRDDGNPGINTLNKYIDMFTDRASKGKCFKQPYLGMKEYVCYFELSDNKEFVTSPNINPDMDLGNVIYDLWNLDTHTEYKPTMFYCTLKNGVVTYPSWEMIKAKYNI